MVRTKQIVARIPVEEYNFVKAMGGSFSQIWEIGFEKWSLEYPDFLQKKIQEYKKLYLQCIDKMQNCTDIVLTKKRDLDGLYREYVEHGRNIKHPSPQDKSWVRARLTKLNKGISIDTFFTYCKKRFEDDRQRKLALEEGE